MDEKLNEEEEKGMGKKNMTGACRFCGQQQIVNTEKELTGPQLEEEATRQCQCEEAVKYTNKLTQKDRARKRIDELFGEGAGNESMEIEVVNGIVSFSDLICDKQVRDITVSLVGGEKAKLKLTAKDKLKIERIKTKSRAFEE